MLYNIWLMVMGVSWFFHYNHIISKFSIESRKIAQHWHTEQCMPPKFQKCEMVTGGFREWKANKFIVVKHKFVYTFLWVILFYLKCRCRTFYWLAVVWCGKSSTHIQFSHHFHLTRSLVHSFHFLSKLLLDWLR